MRNVVKAALIAVALALAAPVAAQDFDAGLEAYKRGDYAAALREWRPLAEQGHAQAQFNLGYIYDLGLGVAQDYAEAAKWFRKAAGQGVPLDYAEALKLFRKAADQGNAVAQVNLGGLYFGGLGVPLDYAEAAKWFRKAADQGEAKALVVLGGLYFGGRGVAVDYVQAHLYWSLAASRGDEAAPKWRDMVAGRMTPEQIAEAQKLAREWKPK